MHSAFPVAKILTAIAAEIVPFFQAGRMQVLITSALNRLIYDLATTGTMADGHIGASVIHIFTLFHGHMDLFFFATDETSRLLGWVVLTERRWPFIEWPLNRSIQSSAC
jgi:hypothetical protein